jgi:tetratricopeptide (TPR) repeat protein
MRILRITIGVLTTGLLFSRPAWGQRESLDEQTLRSRLEQTLLRNPSRGSVFERLYQSYMDGEGIVAWRDRLERLTESDSKQAAVALVLGFVRERQGDDSSALQAYEEAERREPQNFRPLAARGRLLAHLARYDEAARTLARAVTLKPPRQELMDLFKSLGRIYARQGNMEDAKKCWRDLADLYPRDASVAEELAELLIDEGELEEAIGHYERLRQLTDDDYLKVRFAHSIVDLRLRQGKFDEGITLLRELLDQLAPDSWLRAETRRLLDQAFRAKGDLEALVKFYEDWLAARPDDVDLRLALVNLHRELGQTDDALACYEELIRRAGKRRDVRQGLAALYLDLGRISDAAEQLQRAADLAPDDASLWEQLGAAWFDDLSLSEPERRDRASGAWRHILQERPKDPSRAVRTADVFRAHKLEKEAIEHYERAIELAPETTVYHEYIGEYLYQLDRRDEAVARWREIVAGRRATVGNWTRLAEIFSSFGLPDEALQAVSQALTQKPDGLDGFRLAALRSDLLIDQEKFDEAEAALVELATRAESPAQQRNVMDRRVKWAQRSGRLGLQIEQLTKHLNQKPLSQRDADSLELLARMLQASSRWSEAVEAVERALGLDGRSVDLLKLAVDLYRQAGDAGKAMALLNRLIELDPRQESIQLEEIADLARRQGDLSGAIAAGERLMELAPESESGYRLTSDLYWSAGQGDAAVATLRRGIRRNPKSLALHTQLSRRLMEFGTHRAALDQYWRAFEVAEEPSQKLQVANELISVYVGTGQFDRLVDLLTERRRDTQDQVVPTLALAAAYRATHQSERAEQELLRALAARPTDTSILEQLLQLSEDDENRERALVYAEKLVALRPGDPSTLQRLGELLFVTGRVDRAVSTWSASLQANSKDPARNAIQLAELLASHGLRTEARQTLQDAAARYPDDWRVRFLLAISFKSDQQFERARSLFDQILHQRPPSVDLAGGSGALNPSYLRGAREPASIYQWVNLKQIQSATAEDFAEDADEARRFWAYSRFRTVSMCKYFPPDFESAQLAALVQRLHIAELEQALPQYLGELAERAGFVLKLHSVERLTETDRAGNQPSERDAAAQATPSSANVASRIVFLKALLCVQLYDEAFEAARQFATRSPDDESFSCLVSLLGTVPDGANETALFTAIATEGISDPFRRPAAAKNGAFDVEPVLRQVADRQPEAAVRLALLHAVSLIARNQHADAARWLGWALDRRPPLDSQYSCLQLLLLAGRPDEAIKHLPAARAEWKKTLQASTSTSTGTATLPYPYQRQPDSALMLPLAERLLAHHEGTAARELFEDFLGATAPNLVSVSRFGGDYGAVFSLNRPRPEFPSVNAFFDQTRLATLKEWHRRFMSAGIESDLERSLESRLQANPGSRPDQPRPGDPNADTAMTLAMLDGIAGRIESARDRLLRAADEYGDDRVRVVLAQILLQLNQPDDALAQFRRVSAPIGHVLEESLVGQLQTAEQLGRTDLARQVANKLFGMRLIDSDSSLLQSHLRALGLDHQLGQLLARTAGRNPSNSSPSLFGGSAPRNRTVERIRHLISQNSHDAILGLARQVIGDRARTLDLSDDEGELAATIHALEEIGELAGEITRLEEAVGEQAPSAGDPKQLVENLGRLNVLYELTGEKEKLGRVNNRLLAARPDNAPFRWRLAVELAARNEPEEAIEQFERILTEAPWVIDDGRWMIVAFDNCHRLEQLIDRLVTIEPYRRFTVTDEDISFAWMGRLAEQLEDEHPDSSLRLQRRRLELARDADERLTCAQMILRLLVRKERSDEALAEFARLLPPRGVRADGRDSFATSYASAAQTLFSPTEPNQRRYRSSTSHPSTFFGRLVRIVSKHDKLQDLEKLIAEGSKDDEWRSILGGPCQSLVELSKNPPVTTAVEQLISEHEKGASQDLGPAAAARAAVQRCLIAELSRDPSLVKLAARVAACRLPEARVENEDRAERFALLSVLAKAAAAAGNRDQAKSYYQELAKIEPRQGHHYRDRLGWETFLGMREQIDEMRATGFYDIAMDALLGVISRDSNVNWSPHPCETLLAEWIGQSSKGRSGDPARSESGTKECAEIFRKRTVDLERQLTERPHDYTVAGQLARCYRVAGRPEKEAELLLRVAKMPGVSDELLLGLAQQLDRIGSSDRARDILLQLLRDGSTDWARHSWRSHVQFRQTNDIEKMVTTIESLPREPRFVPNGPDWITRLGDDIEETLQDRLPDVRRMGREAALRVHRVADSFSTLAGSPGLKNRESLESIAIALERLNRHDEALDVLMRAVFDAQRTKQPEPSFAALFGCDAQGKSLLFNQWRMMGRRSRFEPSASSPSTGIASHMSWLANKTGRVEALRDAIKDRLSRDSHWEDTALRMQVLLELEAGATGDAKPLLDQILVRPNPPTLDLVDRTLGALAARAAIRPELLPLACRLLAKEIEARWAAPLRDNDESLLSDTTRLLALYWKAGDDVAASRVLKRLTEHARRMDSSDSDQLLVAVAATQVRAGRSWDAVQLFRKAITTADRIGWLGEGLDGVDSELPQSRRTHEFVRLLVRLRNEGKLNELLPLLRSDWSAGSTQPVGKRNCEPVITLAAIHLLDGQVSEARNAMAQLDDRDAPRSVALLVDALGEASQFADGLDIVDEAFLRWPHYFHDSGEKLAVLHIRAQRPLPLQDPRLVAILSERPKENSMKDRISETRSALDGIATVLDRAGMKAEYASLLARLAPGLDDRDDLFRWLVLVAETDPMEAFAQCRRHLGFVPGDNHRTGVQNDSLNAGTFFGECQLRIAETMWEKEVRDSAHSLAELIIVIAQRANRLDAFVQEVAGLLADSDSDQFPAGSPRSRDFVCRLHLLSLLRLDPARTHDLLVMFRERTGDFRRTSSYADSFGNRSDDRDVVFLEAIEACWRIPELRNEAIECVLGQVEQERNDAERSQGIGRTVTSSDLRLRLAEMQFAAGRRDDAIRTCQSLIQNHVDAIHTASGSTRGSLTSDVRRITELAEQNACARELRDWIRSIRSRVTEFPYTDQTLGAVERRLSGTLGDSVPPGIVLAVLSSDIDRIRFVWQLSRTLQPITLENEDLDKAVETTRRISVPFVDADQAVASDGYEFRLEASADRKRFQPVRANPVADGGGPAAGVYLAEVNTETGVLLWYRACLYSGGELVATSRAIAAVAAPNMLPNGSFSSASRETTLPPGWRLPVWWLGRPEVCPAESSGVLSFDTVRANGSVAVRLESSDNIPVDSNRHLVMSGWSIRRPTNSDPSRLRNSATGDSSSINAAFLGSHDTLVGKESVGSSSSAAITFTQCVIDPSGGSTQRRASATTFARTPTDSRLDDVRAMRCSLFVSPRASLGRVTVVQGTLPTPITK